jgi:TRAP transporter TAXI family solute receptor
MRLAVALALALALVGGGAGAQDLRLFTVGSGDLGGGYWAAAEALCGAVNRAQAGRLRCSPEPTSGSLYNLAMLREAQLDFAFAQSDWQDAALKGVGPFAKDGPMGELRSVLALYAEMITVVASKDSGIAAMEDLVGKRIDIGPPGSGRNASIRRLFGELGLAAPDFAAVEELPIDSAFAEICNARLDASVLIIGHPNEAVGRLVEECGAQLVPVAGRSIDEALAGQGALAPAVIPAGTYPSAAVSVPTYATTATVVTLASTADDIVEALVGTTLRALPGLAVEAPVLRGLEPADMDRKGLVAPLHPAAEAAFAAFRQ